MTNGWKKEYLKRKMKRITTNNKNILWNAIDLLYPKHNDRYKPPLCTDNSPNGWGFKCKRCQAIVDLENIRKIKIWPRKVRTAEPY